ncbi:MAG: hypothetical protein ACREA0_14405, partial [bacterium]
MTGRVLTILAPAYILILGTAGGVSRQRVPLRTGDVVIPRVIHSGTLKDTSLRTFSVQQPSAGLYATAWSITNEDCEKWRRYIRGRPPRGDYEPNAQSDSELVSADVNIPSINSPVLK